MHNTQKYIYTVLTVSLVHTSNCVGEMRERGGAPIGQSGVVTSGATESHSMQLETGSHQLLSPHQAHIFPSCLHFLKICLCRDFQSFEKSQFLLVEWRKWWLPHQTHISTVFNFCRFLLGRLSVFLKISLCGIVGWGVGGGLGSVALLDSHLQALFTFGRCSRCYRIVPWQKSSQ